MKGQRLTLVHLCGRLLDLIVAIARLGPQRLARRRVSKAAALQALCENAISVEEYLMLKLEAAIAPLVPLLRAEQLAAIRAAVRERLRTDPGWIAVTEEIREMVIRESASRRSERRSRGRSADD